MAIVDEYILGNAALHAQFSVATGILSEALAGAPLPVTVAQLANCTGQSVAEVEKICNTLAMGNLIKPDADGVGWLLACEPGATTLEDVFRCMVAGQAEQTRPPRKQAGPADHIQRDVGLLVMQVTMAINQSVFKYLRQFPVARLSGSGGTFVDSWMSARASRYDDADSS